MKKQNKRNAVGAQFAFIIIIHNSENVSSVQCKVCTLVIVLPIFSSQFNVAAVLLSLLITKAFESCNQ